MDKSKRVRKPAYPQRCPRGEDTAVSLLKLLAALADATSRKIELAELLSVIQTAHDQGLQNNASPGVPRGNLEESRGFQEF